jgi:hypothetical protein
MDSISKKASLRRKSQNWGYVDLDDEKIMQKTLAQRFDNYYEEFMNLTKRDKMRTKNPVLFCLITFASPKRAIMLTNFKTGTTTGYEILNYDLEVPNARLR